MKENELTHKPHVGSEPVKAEPNAYREKTYEPSNSPEELRKEREQTPIRKAEDNTEAGMEDAADKVKKRL